MLTAINPFSATEQYSDLAKSESRILQYKYGAKRDVISGLAYIGFYIGEGGATWSCGAKRFFCHYRKTKNGKKTLTWPTAAINNKTSWHKKMHNMAFLDSKIFIVIGFWHV